MTSSIYVGGEAREAKTDETLTVVNPANKQAIGEVPNCGPEDVDDAVRAAEKAFETWRFTSPKERSELLIKFAAALEQEVPAIAALESTNAGKPITAARLEASKLPENLHFFAGAARCVPGLAVDEYRPNLTMMIRRDPIGVVGLITPWNYPLNIAIWQLGPALACGNTVVLKPSELTPMTTLLMAEIANEIFPPGVVNVITGTGELTGAEIVRHPKVRMIALTGDSATGKVVAGVAAESMKRVHLELGGKAPVVVLDDADLSEVARGIREGGFVNSGQDCTAGSRIIATSGIHDQVVDTVSEVAKSINVGDPAGGEAIEMGPVISETQQERVLGFLERASHAETVTGGNAIDGGYFIEPTVITGVAQEDEIVQREVFGPVITVQSAGGFDEAIAMANDVSYGLSASVWTQNVAKALDAVRRIDAGTVWVNDHGVFITEMPHGGTKESGHGKDLSVYSLEDYSNIKNVIVRIGPQLPG